MGNTMNDNLKEREELAAFDAAVESARLLGAADAKRWIGDFTDEDARFVVAMHQSIGKHRAAIEASRAAVPAGLADATTKLLSHIEDVVPDAAWEKIDTKSWNKVTGLLATAPQPVAQPGEPIAYTPGEWFDATTVDLMQAFFESRLPAIRAAAKEHGYAIGLHGSMRRDLDLIAAPWREGAADADTLAHAIAMAACGITRAGVYDWEQKPAGRVATYIPICWTHRHGVLSDGHIDLSVAPVAQAKPEQAAQQWQPIETAPKDGTNILLRFGSDGVSQGKFVPGGLTHPWKFIDTNDGITWMVNHAIDGPGGPSHWMSLPAAPQPKD